MAKPPSTAQVGAVQFRRHLEAHGLTAAGKLLNPVCSSDTEAEHLIRLYVETFLAQNKKVSAATVLLGENRFNPRPQVVRTAWEGIENNQCVIIPGGAALGKSYTGIVWFLMRWWQDPYGTTIKVMSTTGKHTESNIFGTMKMLHGGTCIPMPGIVNTDGISATEGDKRFGVQVVRIRAGEDNSEVLQGFHPLPRNTPHPLFGNITATMAVLDECEGIANGVWTGVANMKASGDKNHVKVAAFYNPKDITAPPALYAEPQGGWGEFDVETGVRGKDTWVSAKGWYVIRLDPRKTENVRERKVVFQGFQTYEANREYEEQDGGNSQHYYVFGRGCYPPDSAVNAVTPQRVIAQMRGEFIFSGRTRKHGGVDVAIDGRDDAIFTVGRAGLARAFNRQMRGPDGKLGNLLVQFKKERYVAQIDQQFSIKKGSTEIVAQEIKKHANALQIAPRDLMIDATGNGEPVYLLLRTAQYLGPDVRGIRFGADATETKILDEDTQLAAEQFDGIVSEVLFAITRWGEFGYLAVSPAAASEELERQLGGRRYKLGPGKTLKVEDKDDYQKRLGRSPDHGDSASIWLHGVRTAPQAARASMTDKAQKEQRGLQFDSGLVDRVTWMPSEDGGV